MSATAVDIQAIEFDACFRIGDDGEIYTSDKYAPRVEHSDTSDIEIDSDEWEAFSIGYTGQYGYNGATMHASEYLGGRLAEDILSTPGTYVVTTVEAPCTDDDPCFPDEPNHCREYGCDAEPAGWTVLRLKDDA